MLLQKIVFSALVIALLVYAYLRSEVLVRWISVAGLLLGFIALEIYARHAGGHPYFCFASPFQDCLAELVPPDSIRDYHFIFCDSMGVNKLDARAENHRERVLNGDGFPSHYEFSDSVVANIHANGKKAIMLIGDSYTYGLSAELGMSFAEQLNRDPGYAVFNAGIPGTDAPQYEAVIREYIAGGRLKPDQVIVCLTSNDLGHFPDRRLTPGVPLLYYTNVGGIYTYQGGLGPDTIFRSATDAYRYILMHYTVIGASGDNALSWLLGRSVVISRIIGRLSTPAKVAPVHISDTIDPVISHMEHIRSMCQYRQVPVTFVLLPCRVYLQQKKSPEIPGVVPIGPDGFSLDDYPHGSDDHPLNSGHLKIARELKKLLVR